MKDQQKVTVRTNETLVGLGNSRRLTVMRQSIIKTARLDLSKNNKPILNGTERDIQLAQALIQKKIAAIKSNYPQGKREKFFALRYASEEKLKQMSLQELFSLLKIREPLASDLRREDLIIPESGWRRILNTRFLAQ